MYNYYVLYVWIIYIYVFLYVWKYRSMEYTYITTLSIIHKYLLKVLIGNMGKYLL